MKKIIVMFAQIIAFTSFGVFSIFAAPDDIDPSFNAALYDYPSGKIEEIVIQPDGKILIGGLFTAEKGKSRTGIARFNQDGSIDATFNPAAITPFLNVSVKAIAVQADGKILIGGGFSSVGGVIKSAIARLNSDGSHDTSFNVQVTPSSSGRTIAEDIEILPNGQIIVVGNFNGNAFRLNPNGTIDSSFLYNSGNGELTNVEIQPDGKILIAGTVLVRLNADGTIDGSFNFAVFGTDSETKIYALELLSDGKIVAGGNFSTINGSSRNNLARFNSDGTFDSSYAAIPNLGVRAVLPLADGKFLIGGIFTNYNGTPKSRIALTESDGNLNATFNYVNNHQTISALAVQADGKFWVGGDSGTPQLTQESVNRLNPNGTLDAQGDTGLNGIGYKILTQPDGKILVGGFFRKANGVVVNSFTRLNSDGSKDPNFNQTAITAGESVYAFDVQSDGKILVAGSTFPSFFRLNPNGTTELTIGAGGQNTRIRDLKSLPDGKILVAGGLNCSPFADTCTFGLIRRYESDGTPDSTFNSTVNGYIRRMAVQSDGKIVIVGDFTQINGFARNRIARLNADGTIDTTFNPGGGANNTVTDLALQADGKVIIVGSFTGVNFNNRTFIARLNADGSYDANFTPTFGSEARAVKVQPDGKILVGGIFSLVNNIFSPGLARLNSDGTFDSTLSVGLGAFGGIRGLHIQPDGKILATGEFISYNKNSAAAVARILNSAIAPGNTMFDFDGDRRADITVYRPSNNVWYQLLGINYQFAATQYGLSGDVLTPADFDGDGKTDLGIFRQSSGDWVYTNSANGNASSVIRWGQNGDVPLPGDFTGDGKADFIIYRPAALTWYRFENGGNTFSFVPFGAANDKPVLGDFDGDGKVDPAVFRPSSGEWFYAASSQNGTHLRAAQFGLPNDQLVPADYDGDGKTDAAIFRNGLWAVYNSGNGSNTILTFGQSGDIPVAADYDGDGKADFAVYRPSNGAWYQLRSTQGFSAVTFGTSGDIPISSVYVR